MYSSIAAFARSIRPMIKPRLFSSLASGLGVPRFLAPKTLTPARNLSAIPVPFASDIFPSTTAVNPEDNIRRTDGDENLLRFLQEVAGQTPLEVELPKDSPFVIIDGGLGTRAIALEREFQGEKIEVCAFKFSNRDADEDESEQDAAEGQNTDDDRQDAAEGQNTDDDRQENIGLFIQINKAGLTLKFVGYLYKEDFEIRRMELSEDPVAENFYYAPDFADLDEGLQRTLTEYIGARGVNVSLCKVMWEYLMKTDDRKYRVWLMNLKEFVEK